ncbi:MAG TPA: hypothetical protein VFW44_08510 [Bryobacteraceae bacterium]|nr:hypothetical protein [Bryobacteraceae bacterium]
MRIIFRTILTACVLITPGMWAQIVNGNFSGGNTGFSSGYTFGDVSNPATYTIGTNPSTVPGAFMDWTTMGDHTTGTGNMFIANGGASASTPVWSETVTVSPNTSYVFSFWGMTVSSSNPASLVLQVNGTVTGAAQTFGAIGVWQNFTVGFNSGSGSSVTLTLLDNNTGSGGNDFALDDISLNSGAPAGTPAPSSLTLVGVGLLSVIVLVGLRRRRIA